jgi:long-chain fatty acid transport protein
LLFASGVLGISTDAAASGFQIWEQDGASEGNYHAGYAAEANDASIAWYNPAGITRIHNQQILVSGTAIVTDFRFKGNVTLAANALGLTQTFNSITAQGGTFNLVPSLQYVAPINDRTGFGFSVDVPFGLKTDYGNNTPLRYAATLTSISVIDISPSLAFKLNDQASIGAGFDIQRAYAEFNNIGGLPFNPQFDSSSMNDANDTGYGFHAGILYEFTPYTRAGISYHSQVVHHFTGTSKFSGPLTIIINEGVPVDIISKHARTSIKLPPYTALSFFHQFNPSWAFMASVIYTQWNTFKVLAFQGGAGIDQPTPDSPLEGSTNIEVVVPENYRNTINVSLGANYYPTDSIILRAGIGYDESPATNAFRNVRLPDADRYAIALGAHFKATKTIGLDIGWSHIFAHKVVVNPPAATVGAQTVSTDGYATGGADVLSGQIVWDIL